ncbi:diguanylate cyclase [Pararobbsia alpina]|uniref:putative bifunctional diguanylate cyclase/phosphodiesterase n=1 Tax=Pararobbsia alpina TaxID=621374 RepID=UPI0039A703D7
MKAYLPIRRLTALASIPRGNPTLLIAQFKAFARQMPLMYLMLTVNTWAIAFSHAGVAPRWATLYAPLLLTFACARRSLTWLRMRRVEVTAELAERTLSRTGWLAILIAIAFTVWALGLFRYGDAYAQSHVAFYMAITVIGVIFSLMHLRPAAITVTVIVNGAFVIFFLMSGHLVFKAIAVNTAIVSAVMLIVMLNYYRDFTLLIDAQAENERLANLDSLTGLPNRRAFFHELNLGYAAAVENGTALAAGIIDLDGFKPVNDVHGHAIGDRVLCRVGERIAKLCAPDVYFARLGGDEFAMLVTHATSTEALRALGEQICQTLREPIVVGDVTIQISGSVGFAVYPAHAETATDLYEFADYALYYGKRNHRGSATVFSSLHEEAIRYDARIEQALQTADLHREMSVVFQPIIQIFSGRIIAFEALARWSHPTLGQVPPDRFILVAERIGLVNALTKVLLAKALVTTQRWPDSIRLSFNLSAHDLGSTERVRDLIDLIVESGVDPSRIDFEITETALINDARTVQASTEQLREVGCGVSLDDFGTGYSSLSHLHAFPLTKIKIDRSFVANMHNVPASYKIVKSLLALARDMNLDCVVEGIESDEELQALKIAGGEFAQGYLFSRPISADATMELLEEMRDTTQLSLALARFESV